MTLHVISVRIEIESETEKEALSALSNILDQYEMADGTLKSYKVLTPIPTTRGMGVGEIIGLLAQWKALLVEQRQLTRERGKGNYYDGIVGILVEKDEVALKYQALSGRIWDIKWAIFNDYQTEV